MDKDVRKEVIFLANSRLNGISTEYIGRICILYANRIEGKNLVFYQNVWKRFIHYDSVRIINWAKHSEEILMKKYHVWKLQDKQGNIIKYY